MTDHSPDQNRASLRRDSFGLRRSCLRRRSGSHVRDGAWPTEADCTFFPGQMVCQWRDQSPNTVRAVVSARAGEITLRTATVILILVNIVLGIALLAPPPSRASSANRTTIDGPFRCCRGEGPEAYCCYMCCWRGPYCALDSECGDAE